VRCGRGAVRRSARAGDNLYCGCGVDERHGARPQKPAVAMPVRRWDREGGLLVACGRAKRERQVGRMAAALPDTVRVGVGRICR